MVRWRLKTGLEQLRATLDQSIPRWQRALMPLGITRERLVDERAIRIDKPRPDRRRRARIAETESRRT